MMMVGPTTADSIGYGYPKRHEVPLLVLTRPAQTSAGDDKCVEALARSGPGGDALHREPIGRPREGPVQLSPDTRYSGGSRERLRGVWS